MVSSKVFICRLRFSRHPNLFSTVAERPTLKVAIQGLDVIAPKRRVIKGVERRRG